MSVQTVARRYSSALADVVIERGEANEVKEEIDAWSGLIVSNPQLRDVFGNPTVPYDQKQKVLEQLIERSHCRETTASFLRVLLKNQRLGNLPEISARLAQILDERGGIVAADITTARSISDQVRNELYESLATATGRKVRLSFETDESIIGGVIARIGSTVFDGSVQSQLERLAEELAGK